MNDKELISLTKDFFKENGGDPASLKKAAAAAKNGEPVQQPEPVDMYQQEVVKVREDAKKQFPKGSTKRVAKHAADVAERLRLAYKRAKSDSELLRERGDRQRADMVISQYMEDYFLPAIEALTIMDNVDEILNSKEALNLLDQYALVQAGSGSGYTKAYLESLYDEFRGKRQGMSDHEVIKSIAKIHKLVEMDEIRTAISLANKIKNKIDRGENQASDEDYDLIATVVARG